MTCSLCGYNMEPLEAACRKCKGQGVAASAPPVPELRGDMGYQRPDYAPPPPPKRDFFLHPNVLVGGIVCLGGLIGTIVGYMNASPGKTYPIFWGAIVFGGYRLFRGLTDDV